MIQIRQLITNHLIVALLALGLAPPVVAADSFTQGTQAYTAKNYTEAEKCLSETVKTFPAYWPAHYYLGHTYLALGRREDARKEYEACIASQPPPGLDVIDICKKTIVSLGGTLPAASTAAPPADGKPADSTKPAEAAAGEKKDEGESYRDKEHRNTVERLRKQASEKIAGIREEMKQAIAAGDASSNHWYKDPDGGQVTRMNDDEKAAIEREFQARITVVQEATEREIAGLH